MRAHLLVMLVLGAGILSCGGDENAEALKAKELELKKRELELEKKERDQQGNQEVQEQKTISTLVLSFVRIIRAIF
jgi:hypothetical protein